MCHPQKFIVPMRNVVHPTLNVKGGGKFSDISIKVCKFPQDIRAIKFWPILVSYEDCAHILDENLFRY